MSNLWSARSAGRRQRLPARGDLSPRSAWEGRSFGKRSAWTTTWRSTGLTRFPVVERGSGCRLVGMIALSNLLAGRGRTLDAEQRRERVFSLTLGRRAG
jgi:hypothetical protein